MTTTPTVPTMVQTDGESIYYGFHEGQKRALGSTARFVVVLAGSQSGKTAFCPWWLWNEIKRTKDDDGGKARGIPNDYFAVTASYDLFKLKLLPSLLEVFEHTLKVGRYWAGDQIIELSDPTDGRFWATRSSDPMWGRIVLRAATSPGGLESLTARGGLLDECGQSAFTLQVWEAIQRRLTLATRYGMGRVFLGTTPYEWNWLKTDCYDRWERRGTPQEMPGDEAFEVIQFDSTENPAFPAQEFARMYRTMPRWRFDMFCRGRFSRPAGQILSCFRDWDVTEKRLVRNDDGEKAPKRGHRLASATFTAPPSWYRIVGMDFGGANTAAGVYTLEERDGFPTGRAILLRTYQGAGGHAGDHVAELKNITQRIDLATGGAPSEDAWRMGYQSAGVPILTPMEASVETGIDRMFGTIATDRFLVMDTERGGDPAHGGGFIDQVLSYSREIDPNGNVTTKIKNKATYHKLDQFRYVSHLLAVSSGLVKGYLPTAPRRHWRASVSPSPWWGRFGALVWREGGQSTFLLCGIDEHGVLHTLSEINSLGETGDQFARRIRAFLLKHGGVGLAPIERGMVQQRINLRIAANAEMFGTATKGIYTGSAVEPFRAQQLHLIPVGAKGEDGSDTNLWAGLRKAMETPGKLVMSRSGTPLTCLSTWLLQSDPADPDEPHRHGPTLWPQALAQAISLRPPTPHYDPTPTPLQEAIAYAASVPGR